MVNHAYRDKERKQILYSTKAYREDISVRFFCPDKNCNAEMYICGYNGLDDPYFRATRKEYSHCDFCTIRNLKRFNSKDYNEFDFDFENLMKAMGVQSKVVKKIDRKKISETSNTAKKSMKSIRMIYTLCKSYDCLYKYNNFTIGQMLVDDRSLYMYPKGIYGFRIIEAKPEEGYFYDKEKLTISMFAPIKSKKFKLILVFDNVNFFNNVKDTMFTNRSKVFVVSGKWQSTKSFGTFSTEITSLKQCKIINKV